MESLTAGPGTRSSRPRLSIALAATLLGGVAGAQLTLVDHRASQPTDRVPKLVADLQKGAGREVSSYPQPGVALGCIAIFRATDDEHGAELRRSDGTPGGTRLLKDVFPGARSSYPSELTVYGFSGGIKG